MTKAEITYNSNKKELEKLEARLERRTKALAKAQAKAEKAGVAEWSNEDRLKWLETVELDGFYIKNKEDQVKNGAWFDLLRAKDDLKETERDLEKCRARLETSRTNFEEAIEKEARETISEEKKAKIIQERFEEMVKEWAEDGITLEGRIYSGFYGKTPQGKKFIIDRNHYGYTRRSLHCYTLTIDGETIFTSGLFETA